MKQQPINLCSSTLTWDNSIKLDFYSRTSKFFLSFFKSLLIHNIRNWNNVESWKTCPDLSVFTPGEIYFWVNPLRFFLSFLLTFLLFSVGRFRFLFLPVSRRKFVALNNWLRHCSGIFSLPSNSNHGWGEGTFAHFICNYSRWNEHWNLLTN